MPTPKKHENSTERQRAFREKTAARLREVDVLEARVRELEARVQELETKPRTEVQAQFPTEIGRARWQAMSDYASQVFKTIWNEMDSASRTQPEFLQLNEIWDLTKGKYKPDPKKIYADLRRYCRDFDLRKREVGGAAVFCRFPFRPGEEVPEDWEEL